MTIDAIITGESDAGLAAAMQLARARRSIAAIDANRRRNRLAPRSDDGIGHDGETREGASASCRRTARR